MENEIKIAFPSEQSLYLSVEQPWFKHVVEVIHDKTEHYENRYLDTPDRDLRQTMTSIRVRHVLGQKYIHTVKTGGNQVHNGLSTKYEWNWITDEREFQVERFLHHMRISNQTDPVEILSDVLFPYKNVEFIDLCQTIFKRRTIHVKYKNSEVEICLDVGSCYGLERSAPILEMELELLRGQVEDIEALGHLVIENTGTSYQKISKLGRCMQLIEEVEHG